MKKLTFLLLVILCLPGAYGQTFDEAFTTVESLVARHHYREAATVALQCLDLAGNDQQRLSVVSALADIHLAMGNSHTARKYLVEKEKMLRAAKTKNRDEHYNTLVSIVYSYSSFNQHEKADSVLRQMAPFANTRARKDQLRALTLEVLMDAGKWDEAEMLLEDTDVYNDYDLIGQQLRFHIFRGNYYDAEEVIAGLLMGQKDKTTAYYKRSFLLLLPEMLQLLALGYDHFYEHPALATPDTLSSQALRYVAELYPGDADWHNNIVLSMAMAYLETDAVEKAEQMLLHLKELTLTADISERNQSWLHLSDIQIQIHEKKGDYVKALWQHEEAQKTASLLFGPGSVAYQHHRLNKATLLVRLGQREEALAICSEAIPVVEKELGKQSSFYSSLLSVLGKIAYEEGNFDESLRLVKDAVAINEQNGVDCNPCHSNLLMTLAGTYERAGEYRLAEDTYISVFEFLQRNLAEPNGNFYYNTFKLALADFYTHALAAGKAAELRYYGLSSFTAFDGLAMKFTSSDPEQPIRSIIQRIHSNAGGFLAGYYGGAHRETAKIDLHSATYEWVNKSRKTAGKLFKSGLDIYLRDINEFFPFMSEKEKTDFYRTASAYFNSYFAYVLSDPYAFRSGGKYFTPTTFYIDPQYADGYREDLGADTVNYSIKPSQLGGEPKIEIQDLHINALLDYRLQTKAILLNATAGIKKRIFESGNAGLVAEYKEWEALRLYVLKLRSEKAAEATLDSLQTRMNQLERRLSAQSEDFRKRDNAVYTWHDVRRKLGPGEAAVEVIRLHHPLHYQSQSVLYRDSVHYALVVVTPQTVVHPKVLLLKNGYEMENRLLTNYHNSIKYKLEDKLSYNAYWQALQPLIAGYSKVYFSADGVYNLINLQSLQSPQAYLLDRIDIAVVTNLRDILTEARPAGTTGDAWLFGDPDFALPTSPAIKTGEMPGGYPQERSLNMDELFRGGVSRLPGTAAEAAEVAGVLTENGWRSNLFVSAQATEENIKQLNRAHILHIATHGFFLKERSAVENPLLRSGLLLAGATTAAAGRAEDGILTAYEALNLNLTATNLVVLSACETALGDVVQGEGVYGLQRALKVAGARQLIMSLWKVDDQVTMELMTHFYREYLKHGKAGPALKASQLIVKEKYKHPYYWAPFVVVGE